MDFESNKLSVEEFSDDSTVVVGKRNMGRKFMKFISEHPHLRISVPTGKFAFNKDARMLLEENNKIILLKFGFRKEDRSVILLRQKDKKDSFCVRDGQFTSKDLMRIVTGWFNIKSSKSVFFRLMIRKDTNEIVIIPL